MSDDRDQKIRALKAQVELLSAAVVSAQRYARLDPEVSLMKARKTAEAICRNVFATEIGKPGRLMLDELIRKLAEKGLLPPRLLPPLGTIQAYGNYGLHPQDDVTPVDSSWITPCLAALAEVTDWYFVDYLGTSMPPAVGDGTVPVAGPAPALDSKPEFAAPATGIGEGSTQPEAFLQGFERNRRHLSDPRGTVRTMSANGGRFRFQVQDFGRADGKPGTNLLAWHESLSQAFCLRDGMHHAYLGKGLSEMLGVPTTDEVAVQSSSGVRAAMQEFKVGEEKWQGRRLYYHLDGPLAGKAFFTLGGIHVRYLQLGAEKSPLGLPTASEEPSEGGAVSRFEGGEIRWHRGTNRVDVHFASRG